MTRAREEAVRQLHDFAAEDVVDRDARGGRDLEVEVDHRPAINRVRNNNECIGSNRCDGRDRQSFRPASATLFRRAPRVSVRQRIQLRGFELVQTAPGGTSESCNRILERAPLSIEERLRDRQPPSALIVADARTVGCEKVAGLFVLF